MDWGRMSGTIVAKVLDKLISKALFPFSYEQYKILVEDNVSLIDLFYELQREYQTGEWHKWKPENKRRWQMLIKAMNIAKQVIPRLPGDAVVRFLTYDSVINYVRTKRPDLLEIFESPAGRVWLRRQLHEIRVFLFGYDPLHPEEFEDVGE